MLRIDVGCFARRDPKELGESNWSIASMNPPRRAMDLLITPGSAS